MREIGVTILIELKNIASRLLAEKLHLSFYLTQPKESTKSTLIFVQ